MFLPAALHLDLAGAPPLPSRRGESPARSPQINPKAGFINSMTPTCVHQQRHEFNADCIFCREIQQKEAEENARDNHDPERRASAWSALFRNAKSALPNSPKTDILGALLVASDLFRSSPARRNIFVIFSDMRQDTPRVGFGALQNCLCVACHEQGRKRPPPALPARR